MQLADLSALHATPPDASKDLLGSIFWQEVHLEQEILTLVRESCSDVLASNAHMTAELTSIITALAADEVLDRHRLSCSGLPWSVTAMCVTVFHGVHHATSAQESCLWSPAADEHLH